MDEKDKKTRVLKDTLGISYHLAKELMILAGYDENIVINASTQSDGLDHCKARIIDKRLSNIEKGLKCQSVRTANAKSSRSNAVRQSAASTNK